MDIRLSLLGRQHAEQRIGYLMLETFDRLRQRGLVDGGSTCPFPCSGAISRTLPASRGCMSQGRWSTLRERRLAEIQNGTLVFFDRPRLAELAGYVPLGSSGGRRALL